MERLSAIARSQIRQLTQLWPALTMHLAMAVLFLCVAVLFGALTGFVGGLTWILVWPAFSLVIVAYGYLVAGPAVLGKQADGTLYWPHALLLMPYFSAAECAWYLVRVLGREDPWHEVARGLYLGRRVQHWELPARVGLVLDMTAEFVEPIEVRSDRVYVCVPALDASVPSVEALVSGIERVASFEGNIYVHCAAGHGRSAMAMAVLLVARGIAQDLDHAVDLMRQARPRVKLRTTQRKVALAALARLPMRSSRPSGVGGSTLTLGPSQASGTSTGAPTQP
ncbi:MAG: protein-tyrosine phosphatase family protein [Myxococcales bacterium]